jgi:hypothetical protein
MGSEGSTTKVDGGTVLRSRVAGSMRMTWMWSSALSSGAPVITWTVGTKRPPPASRNSEKWMVPVAKRANSRMV